MRRLLTIIGIVACCAGSSVAQEEVVGELEPVLHGLEQGMEALHAIDQHELAREMERVADRVRERIDQARAVAQERRQGRERTRSERDIVRGRIELLGAAMRVLAESGNQEALVTAEKAIDSYRLSLEGRHDESAQTRPSNEVQVRIMRHAAELFEQYGEHERANRLRRATEEFWQLTQREERREVEHRVDDQIEVMRIACHGLLEANRADAAEILERAIRARIMAGRDGEEARHDERAPEIGEQIEVLMFAAGCWDEFGHETKAARIRELAGAMRRDMSGPPDREVERDVRVEREVDRETDRLQERVERLEVTMEEIVNLLRQMREDRR